MASLTNYTLTVSVRVLTFTHFSKKAMWDSHLTVH